MPSDTIFIQKFVTQLEQLKEDIEKEFFNSTEGFKEILTLDCKCSYPKVQQEISLPIYLFQYGKIPIFFIIYQNMNELINEERNNFGNLKEKDFNKQMNKLQEMQQKRIFTLYESEEKVRPHGGANVFSINNNVLLFSQILYKIFSEEIPAQRKYYLNNEEIPEYQVYTNIFCAINHPEYYKK